MSELGNGSNIIFSFNGSHYTLNQNIDGSIISGKCQRLDENNSSGRTIDTNIIMDENVTYSGEQIINKIIVRDSLTAARTDTLPTAADLVAAIDNCQINTTFDLFIENRSTQALTIVGNTGIIMINDHLTIGPKGTILASIIVTNTTPGSEQYIFALILFVKG